jgi:hypothetical protein
MLRTHLPGRRLGSVAVLTAAVLMAAEALAQSPPDPLARQGQLTRSERQAEAEVRLAMRQIERLSQSMPSQALERLKTLLSRVKDDDALPAKRRATLKHMLEDRIRVVQAEVDNPATRKDVLAVDRRGEAERREAEEGGLRRLFEEIKRAQKEGKFAEASRRASELAARAPNNPAAVALRRTTAASGQLADSREVRAETQRGIAGAIRGVERSAVPPSGDLEFPKDWKEKTQLRKRANAVRMTAKERAIMQALDSPVSVDFKDSPLDAALEYLRTVTGQPIIVDPGALDAAGVTYETKVTLRVKGVGLRTVLRKVLGELGLTYVVMDEAIQVITPQQARAMTVTRVYYIGNLITGDWFDTWFGLDEVVAARNAAFLIDLIKSTMDPQSWDTSGGPGTIVYHHPTQSLVIKQTAEFHGVLSGGLR